uniref:TTF-type domain-containing protein n=1 Tax=Photinus pyralis TaxID=7054 RepID=A0A1Y1MZW7_PHOPY
MLPKKKLSGAEFKKIRAKKLNVNQKSASLMQTFIKLGSRQKGVEEEMCRSGDQDRSLSSSTIIGSERDNECENNTSATLSEQIQEIEAGENNGMETESTSTHNSKEDTDTQVTSDLKSMEKEGGISSINSSSELELEIINYNNPVNWKGDKVFLEQLIKNGPVYGDNLDCYPVTNTRQFSKKYFSKILPNGNSIQRKWLFYCIERDVIYCFPCLLFGGASSQFSTKKTGFRDWHNIGPRVKSHENSTAHKKCVIDLITFEINLKKRHFLTDEIQKMILSETERWKHILKCILDAILFCVKNNEALRGSVEKIGHPNSGKFLQTLELISHYDPILKQHIDSENHKKYFSPKIQNELIAIAGNAVRNEIVSRIKQAKYFSVILDTTPDVSKSEQLSLVVRYVEKNGKTCSIEERFLMFIEVKEKTGYALANILQKVLQELGLDIQNIRGQAYDNGSNMAGQYQGVQARILQENPTARFVPCSAHSLNLVALHSASISPEIITFFGIIQNLFNFFAHSTVRWTKLKNALNITLKGFSDTRWSSKALALNALITQFELVLDLLEEMTDVSIYSGETVIGAKNFQKNLKNFNFVILLVFWSSLLNKINKINLLLQKKDLTLDTACKHIKGLLEEIKENRDGYFEKSERDALQICQNCTLSTEYTEVRKRKIKKMSGELADDFYLDPKTKQKQLFFQVIDSIITQLSNRYKGLHEICSDFSFLNGSVLSKMSLSDTEKCINALCDKYPNDFNCTEFIQEAESFKFQTQELFDIQGQSALEIYQNLHKYDLMAEYPNFATALHIFLTIPVTSASCERTFSKLKLLKNYLRSTMSQQRLSNTAILSIERIIAESISFDKYISDFASQKARQCCL